jgi:hypothetical protein
MDETVDLGSGRQVTDAAPGSALRAPRRRCASEEEGICSAPGPAWAAKWHVLRVLWL